MHVSQAVPWTMHGTQLTYEFHTQSESSFIQSQKKPFFLPSPAKEVESPKVNLSLTKYGVWIQPTRGKDTARRQNICRVGASCALITHSIDVANPQHNRSDDAAHTLITRRERHKLRIQHEHIAPCDRTPYTGSLHWQCESMLGKEKRLRFFHTGPVYKYSKTHSEVSTVDPDSTYSTLEPAPILFNSDRVEKSFHPSSHLLLPSAIFSFWSCPIFFPSFSVSKSLAIQRKFPAAE